MRAIQSKPKIMTIIGTRPEIIKMSSFIKKSTKYFENILVHTGQNYDYELNGIFFKELNLQKPDYFLNVVGDNLGETIGNIIEKSYELIEKIKPEAIVVLGDTNSCLSVLSAKRLKIPVFHLEAGNRCFDENLPEEINRRIVDHISDINMCYSEHARLNLLNEGLHSDRIFVVGSPMAEIISDNLLRINESQILQEMSLKENQYILLSAHREENIDIEKNFMSLMNAINGLAHFYNVPIVYPVHPRSLKMIKKSGFIFDKNVKLIKPLSFFDYNKLQMKAMCVVSDSGTIAEEASYYKIPAVSIRTSTERPESIDKGNLIIGNITTERLIQATQISILLNMEGEKGSNVPDYVEQNFSLKVIKIIISYIDIINRLVWRK
ncbi:UDP-N-acetylglucosamine 2-epimerase (non-hydrolyzing) [Acholeplasma vituli]|uniref:UDP-N-acetylglucosamine 2-epimerase (Non-hydrolyzing) n=1 Tax=Paracholeplasma vituli TaxID=69473 RepID=A0ABT2PWY7_9MOLU|nr:UDP-N-acetylglucosamine 2-epimerase (non-hydrolyzing) [Paracholeplasma vituli]MCU0104168.1 UDP-N-acetylglucosamine 2-epimerase (non-hydrolyzing) [Paracholeplasma vituli]